MRILIIEDDLKTAEFVINGFRQSGFVCAHAATGEDGLFQARHGSFDIAITDIMLPGLSGLDVIRQLRAEGNRLPVIVLSALGSVESKIAGLEAGGDDYLAKPFSVAELLARVQALLRRVNGTPEPTVLKVADLEMDLVSHRVRRGGVKIDLQPLEYQLLEYLMRNTGRVVSKTTIMERVWDYNFDPHTNVVEARVCRIRDKIETNATRKLIRTVRGFGYVLE